MLQSRWPDNFFKLDMEAQTVDGQNIQRADLDPRLDPLPPHFKVEEKFHLKDKSTLWIVLSNFRGTP